MELKNFSLSIKNTTLFLNVNVGFQKGKINHILGQNGTGKTCLAKAIVGAFKYKGEIKCDVGNVCVIGSYTNLPLDLKVKDVIKLILQKFEKSTVELLIEKLNINDIIFENKIKNLSDGQKQKLKLLFFLSSRPSIVILDEVTSNVDKKSCLEIYKFLNSYIKTGSVTALNITHNLTDIEYLDGEYYLIKDKNIIHFTKKESIINDYIKG